MSADGLQLSIRCQGVERYRGALVEALEVGRQTAEESALALWTLIHPAEAGATPAGTTNAGFSNADATHATLPASPMRPARLLIAARDERDYLSRRHVRLTPVSKNRVKVTNLSERRVLVAGEFLEPRLDREATPPFSVIVHDRHLDITGGDPPTPPPVRSLTRMTIGPWLDRQASIGRATGFATAPSLLPDQIDPMIGWMQETMALLNRALGSEEFLDESVRLMVENFNLDSAVVLLERQVGDLTVVATHGRSAESGPAADPGGILSRVRHERRTCYLEPKTRVETTTPQIVLASPLLDESGRVVGFLCGEQRGLPLAQDLGGMPNRIEAAFLDLLASGISTRLVRREREGERARLRCWFPEVVMRRVLDAPGLLDARETRITILATHFLRREGMRSRPGPQEMFRRLIEIHERTGRIVEERGGVVVARTSDGFAAMWGAPLPNETQEADAVRTALAIGEACRLLAEIQEPPSEAGCGTVLASSSGVLTTTARVGRYATGERFAYGPTQEIVALAEKTSGAGRQLRCDGVVASGETIGRLATGEFLVRRVGEGTFEVAAFDPSRREVFRTTEEALALVEQRRYREALRLTGTVLPQWPEDGPLLAVVQRAIEGLRGSA